IGVDARDGGARAVELEHRQLLAGADVEGAAVVPGRGEQRVDDIADVNEVARLQPVAEDDRLLAAGHPLEEDRHDAALEAGVLPRPIYVREPERDVRSAVDPVSA